MRGVIALLGYGATIPAANWMIANVGACNIGGPCVIPVGFGFYAPSGVLIVGAALVLRDAVHSSLGAWWAVVAIVLGAAMSALIAPPALVFASVAAFAISEVGDLAVYSPLRRRNLWAAILASGVVGSLLDSAVFLWAAFGSLDLITGQVIGKFYASAAVAAAILAAGVTRMSRDGITPRQMADRAHAAGLIGDEALAKLREMK